MRIVYIAHPISGDIQGNLEKVKQIARELNLTRPDIVPFAPYWFDCHVLDDNIPEERERGIQNDRAFFERRMIDEVWLYGDRLSSGMAKEVLLAHANGIPVFAMTKETANCLSSNNY